MKAEFRSVFDTNVIVSALLQPRSVPRQALDRATGRGKMLLSTPVVEELDAVLRRGRFDRYLSESDRLEFLAALQRDAILIDVTGSAMGCRDPKDDKFLELAVGGDADCLVSGDRDPLTLHPFRSIPIMTPQAFLTQAWESDPADPDGREGS